VLHVLASVIAWVLALALTLGFLGAVFWVLRQVLRNSVTPASVRPRGFPGWVALFAGAIAASVVLSLIGWNAVRLAKGEVSLSDLACVGDPTDPCNWVELPRGEQHRRGGGLARMHAPPRQGRPPA
jgi:hypothetical protein